MYLRFSFKQQRGKKNHEYQKTSAVAGTLESSDVYVKVEPCERLEIEIESVVYNQFAQQIEQSVREVTRELGVESGKISVNDKGSHRLRHQSAR